MAWIRIIPPSEATGALAEYYRESAAWSQRRRERWGIGAGAQPAGPQGGDFTHNPDGHLMSLHPAAALAYLRLGEVVHYGEGPLTDVQRQMIATVVSARNHCVY